MIHSHLSVAELFNNQKEAAMKGFFRGKSMGERAFLRYFEKNGELHYEYRTRFLVPTKNHYRAYREYESSGMVPKEVVNEGNMAIMKWVKSQKDRDIQEQKQRFQAWDDFDKNPNFLIGIKHDGVLLKGRVISSEDSTLRVWLGEPEQYQGEDSVIYGIDAALSKRYMFNKDHTFSDDAISTAKNLLIKIYQKQNH